MKNDNGPKAILVTEYIMGGHGASPHTRTVSIPTSRIARATGHPIPDNVKDILARDAKPMAYQSNVTLRTPEDYMLTVESPEQITALMNAKG